MDQLVDPILSPFAADAGARFLLGWGITHFMVFVLVMLRIAGLMTLSPFFGNRSIPMRAKALLAFSVALVLAPTLTQTSIVRFSQLDLNDDGRIERSEVPTLLAKR